MLAQAQQQIMQQRFQNTMNQIGQQQQFLGSLNQQNNQAAGNYAQQGANDINQQYGRQLQGAEAQRQNQGGLLSGAAGGQNNANSNYNQAMLGAGNFAQQNKQETFADQSIRNSDTASSSFSKGLGSMGAGGM